MAVKIKLKRLGKIREPYYRIVVADARTKRDGRAIEEIGKYHPKAEPSLIEVDSERAQHWLKVGAQPTDPVMAILKITGDWQKFKGEPGAEGTLRTAEPRADKKEAFEAAAKQSLAAKEAKETKSGGRSSRGAKDSASSGSAAKDGAAKDSAAKDSAAKDSAAKDSAAKDGAAKSGAAKDTAAKDASAKTARGKGGAAKAAGSDAAGSDAAEPAEAKAEAEPVAAEPVVTEAVSSEEGEAADAGPGSGA